MILSILYSPLLRSLLSRRIPVFLGSISFSLYLLHGTFIRLPLTWWLFKFLARYPAVLPDWHFDNRRHRPAAQHRAGLPHQSGRVPRDPGHRHGLGGRGSHYMGLRVRGV